MPFYRKRSIVRRRPKRRYKKRRTYKRRRTYGRRRTYRKGSRFRRTFKKRSSKPILIHSATDQIMEFSQTDFPAEGNTWQQMTCYSATALGMPVELDGYCQTLTNTLSAANAGVFVENMLYRDLHLLLDKAWMRIEFTNVGNFPTHVEVYVLSPRRNIPFNELQHIQGTGGIYDTYMDPTLNYNLGEQIDNSASIHPQQYGMTPYLFPGLVANFKIRKKFYQLMPPGSVGAFTTKMPPTLFNQNSSGNNPEFAQDFAWKFTRIHLWRIWTIPLAAKYPDAVSGGAQTVCTGPFKLAVMVDKWYKWRANFAGGYRAMWQELNPYPTVTGTGAVGPQYMNPDTGAAQNYDEAGD